MAECSRATETDVAGTLHALHALPRNTEVPVDCFLVLVVYDDVVAEVSVIPCSLSLLLKLSLSWRRYIAVYHSNHDQSPQCVVTSSLLTVRRWYLSCSTPELPSTTASCELNVIIVGVVPFLWRYCLCIALDLALPLPHPSVSSLRTEHSAAP